jgi:5-formyltetrahydrofolate cyclo-ligase
LDFIPFVVNQAVVQREKILIRQRLIKLRSGISPQEQRRKSNLIEYKLFGINRFQQASAVMFYLSFRNEVCTTFMIKRALQAGKRVGVPLVCRDEGRLLISEIENMDSELQPGSFGILEPQRKFIRPMELKQLDVVILPGVAFDESGHRLGYGGGYYDKLLQTAKGQLLIGLAYEFQMVSQLPQLAHDVKVHHVVTEQRVINCSAC